MPIPELRLRCLRLGLVLGRVESSKRELRAALGSGPVLEGLSAVRWVEQAEGSR